jgi:type I restriction enzyme S subunit
MNIPTNWQNKPLGSVILDIGDGGTPNTNKGEYFGGPVPWVVIQDIKKHITSTKTTLTENGLSSCSAKLWPAGAVILSTGATIGEVGVAEVPLATKQGIHGIVCSDSLSSEFLYYKLSTLRDFLRANAQGSTIREVRAPFIRTIPIAFPTNKKEQAKIAEVLSTIDRAIEQTEELIAKQQRIKIGLMQDLLTKGIDEHGNIRSEVTHAFKDSPVGRIPVEWDVNALGEVVHVIDPNPSHRYPPVVDIGVPIASTENFLGESDFDLSDAERVLVDVFNAQNARCAFDIDDVVFARKGRIGLARPYGTEKKAFSHTVVLLKPRDNEMQAKFILWSVRFDRFFDEISKRMNSNSGVPTLGVGFIQAIPIPIPPKEERESVLTVLQENESRARSIMQSLEKLKQIKKGLMHDLLTGKRRVTELLAPKTE